MSNSDRNASNLVRSFLQATDRLSKEVDSQSIVSDDNIWDFIGTDSHDGEDNGEDNGNLSIQSNDFGKDVQFEDLQIQGSWEEFPELPYPSVYSTRGQSRTSSRHGRGGRKAGSGFRLRQLYTKYAQIVICNRLYAIFADNPPHATTLLAQSVGAIPPSEEEELEEMAQYFHTKLLSTLGDMGSGNLPYAIQHLPFSVLGISAHFTKTDVFLQARGSSGSSRERHVVNTWLGQKGEIRCTCIGSTQYNILAQNDCFRESCCEHAESFTEILNRIGERTFGVREMEGITLYSCVSALQPNLVDSLTHHLPFYSYVHRDSAVVLVCANIDGEKSPTWVPIRVVERKGIKHLCAFCDLVNTNSCHHVRKLRNLQNRNDCEMPHLYSEGGRHDGSNKSGRLNGSWKKHPPISFLPVAPVNCPFSLKRDEYICDIMKRNETFVLTGPSRCIYCHAVRLEDSKDINTSGTIMCTLGSCGMEVHTYKCSGCNRRFSAEGREEGIYIDRICSAATHVMLREQLIGFALGNGTLKSRLSHLHSRLSSLEDSNVFTKSIPCKSTKTMYAMCVSFVRLMVIDPPKSLFWCFNCQSIEDDTGEVSVPHTVCVDGIWAGYLRKTSRAFRNMSLLCKTENDSKSRKKRTACRPSTGLLRVEKTVSILLQALKGEKVEFTASQLCAVMGAVRIVSDNALPSDFYLSSVCGKSPTDYSEDIGKGRLHRIRELTNLLFDEETLLYRLLKPLQAYFDRQCKRRRKKKDNEGSMKLQEMLSEPSENITQVGQKRKRRDEYWKIPEICCEVLAQAIQVFPFGTSNDDLIPWHCEISKLAEKHDLGSQVFALYKTFLQGPVTHLIRYDNITSGGILAQSCIENDPDTFIRQVMNRDCFKPHGEQFNSANHSNITDSSRLLTAGLFSAAVIDRESIASDATVNASKGKSRLLKSFGAVLKDVLSVTRGFYDFYERDEQIGCSSAAKYCREWNSSSPYLLRNKFLTFSTHECLQDLSMWDSEDIYTTGTFFPSFPQLRPLPFHDAGRKNMKEDIYGFCSKHYLQKNGSFTPGAVTVCCACTHPIIIGFKVLEWDESPRAVLDVLISRFAKFPRFVIYDFACGVYKSAAHPLWWAVKNSSLVSDPFHGCNHKCSSAFLPLAHVELNMTNTISHEQRNRPIANIKPSLQQTSQDVYISLLAFQTIINNIEAKIRTANHTQEPVQNRSEKDIEWGYFHRLNLTCPCCEARNLSKIVSDIDLSTEKLPATELLKHESNGVFGELV